MDAYVGEIRMFTGDYAPYRWAFCWGQSMLIVQYSELFACIGNYYGGDGQTTFNLPDLRGRTPISCGQGPGLTPREMGDHPGEETHLVQPKEMMHSHPLLVSKDNAADIAPVEQLLAQPTGGPVLYRSDPMASPVALHPDTIAKVGTGVTHNNMMPSLCINFIIALEGYFPDPPQNAESRK